jgi:hypothetical protein
MSKDKKEEVEPQMTRQEENWVLMTTLQIPWYHAEKVESLEDRAFLLEKAKEVQNFMVQQQQQQMQSQQEAQSKILTPDTFM